MEDIHHIRKDLLSFVTILEKLLRKVLVSACDICADKQNLILLPGQSNLGAILEKNPKILYDRPFIVYKSKRDMNNNITCNIGNERRLIDTVANRVLLDPQIDTFDVTLIVQLLKNIPENPCFLKRIPCVVTAGCNSCAVKEAAETVTRFRNNAMHNMDNIYKDLETNNVPLPNLGNWNTWNDLKQHVEDTFNVLLAYTTNQGNFPKTGKIISS